MWSIAQLFFSTHFANFDTSMFLYQTFDNGTIFICVRGPLPLCFSGSSFSAVRIFTFVAPHRRFLSAGNFLTVSIHSPAMNLALTHSFCLLKSDYCADLKVAMIFSHTGHFVLSHSSHTGMENSDTSAATSLPDVPTKASDIEVSPAGHI
jgi:hypothetical protein